MFKNGYKIIFIKEGKFDLKQFTISPLQVGLFAGAIILLTSSFFFMFSDQFVEWAGSHEIERHRKNNKVLVKNIENNHKRIGNLLDELNKLKISKIKKNCDISRFWGLEAGPGGGPCWTELN